MLIVQPTSTCDVCLERYAWDSPASSADTEHLQRPHVITCGHVFCHQCLQNLRIPRTCPLCRASFHLTRAVRIHVDLAYPNSPTPPSTAILSPAARPRPLSIQEAEARQLELRLVEAFSGAPSATPSDGVTASTTASGSRATTEAGDGESEGDNRNISAEHNAEEKSKSVVEEAQAWLDNTSNSYPILRALIQTLPSHGTLTKDLELAQAETARLRSEREHLRRHLRRAEKAREQEAALGRSAEKRWLVRVAEVERECELKLTQAETERCHIEEELVRLRAALKESQAAQSDVLVQAHMQIRADQHGGHKTQRHLTSQLSSASLRVAHAPAPRSPRQQERAEKTEDGPSASGSSSIAFPRTSSPTPTPGQRPSSPPRNQTRDPDHSNFHSRSHSDKDLDRDQDYYDYKPSYNPLPRPPEPIPLSRLPAFARPKPGSSAYSAAKALARHGSASLKRGERSDRERDRDRSERKREKGKEREREARTDSEKDRRERKREKGRERESREGERKRDHDHDREGATTDSGRGRRHGKDRDKGHYRVNEKWKEAERGTDRGTDTSTTETQERARSRDRTRHASLVGVTDPSSFSSSVNAGVGASSTEDKPIDVVFLDKGHGRNRDAEVVDSDSVPAIPWDIVGGWGLERSWRASMASSGHSGREAASREDLPTDARDSNLGSSYTKLGFRDDKEKGKGKEKDREGGRREDSRREGRDDDEGVEGEEDVREDFVFVRSSSEYERNRDEHDRDVGETDHRTRERQRHVSFSTHQYDARYRAREKEMERDTSHELPRLQGSSSSYSHPHAQYPTRRYRERERRTTLSAAPSALGLVLVPTPDGRGGYTYAYQYQQAYLTAESTIRTANQAGSAMDGASGKESVTPLANQFFRGTTAVNTNAGPSGSHGTEYVTPTTLSRRATDTALSFLARARRTHASSTHYVTSQQVQARAPSATNNIATTTAAAPAPPLHVPQPRRIELTIPEPPESDTSPQPFGSPQVQRPPQPLHTRDQGHGQTQQAFRTNGTNADLNHGCAYSSSSKSGHGTGQEGGAFYTNASLNANMSLDSALASLGNANSVPDPPPSQIAPVGTAQATVPAHTLRHQTSNSSSASASTGISLTGSTSRERRKQLLDALFSDSSDPASANAGSGSNRSSFTSENAHLQGAGSSKEADGAKGTSIGRILDADVAPGTNGDVSATNAGTDAKRGTASRMANNLASAGVAGQAQVEAPRGVPSRDGRPSRGLSTQLVSTQPQIQPTQPVPGAPTVYYAHHAPTITTSYTRPVTYANTNVPPGTYPATANATQHPTYAYHIAQPSTTAHATGYAAYVEYYQQQQPQQYAQNRSHTYALPRPQAYSLPSSQPRTYAHVDTDAQSHVATASGAAAPGVAVPSNWAGRRQY